MSFFNFFKKSKKDSKSKEQTKINEIKIDNIKGLISLALKNENIDKLTSFINELSKNVNNEFIDESHILNSQELIDYIYEKRVWLYGFFDWKEESENFDYFIKNALRENFSLKINNKSICDLNELNSIGLIYKIYGKELEKLGITLCAINTLSDSYTVMLIENEKYQYFEQFVNNLSDFKSLHYTDEW